MFSDMEVPSILCSCAIVKIFNSCSSQPDVCQLLEDKLPRYARYRGIKYNAYYLQIRMSIIVLVKMT